VDFKKGKIILCSHVSSELFLKDKEVAELWALTT
jgi:hypothetical protein